LKTRRHLSGGSLSGGEQQMLAVSRRLMMQPKVLMLDEPSLGLAPQIVAAILSTLRSLSDERITLILVEQLAMVALSLADDACVLRNGRIAYQAQQPSFERTDPSSKAVLAELRGEAWSEAERPRSCRPDLYR